MLSSLNIEDNNFSQHALIVPTLYNLTIQSKKSNPLYISTNQQTISFVYNKTQAENILKIINLQTNKV